MKRKIIRESQEIPLQPLSHVHVSGLEHVPWIHWGLHIAEKIINIVKIHFFYTNLIPSWQVKPLYCGGHVHTLGAVQDPPFWHAGSHIAEKYRLIHCSIITECNTYVCTQSQLIDNLQDMHTWNWKGVLQSCKQSLE